MQQRTHLAILLPALVPLPSLTNSQASLRIALEEGKPLHHSSHSETLSQCSQCSLPRSFFVVLKEEQRNIWVMKTRCR